MNPLTPQTYDVAFIALIIFNVILTIYVIALISAIDIRLVEKIFATCIVVSLPNYRTRYVHLYILPAKILNHRLCTRTSVCMCGVLGFYGGAHTLFAAYAKFGPVVGCGDVVSSYQAVLSRFRCFSLVGSSSKLQLRTCEACGVVGRKTVTVGDETRGMHYLTWTS